MPDGAFLVANIRGYTRFNQERGNQAAAGLDADFARQSKIEIETHGGIVTALRSGELVARFDSAIEAALAAIEMQKNLSRNCPCPVGIGLAEGSYAMAGTTYVGMAMKLAERLCALAGDREILADDGLASSVGRLETPLIDRGLVTLKGMYEPVRVLQVRWEHHEPGESRIDLRL
jgi:adenylate cyclase